MKLFLFAVLLTAARIFFVSVEDYKGQITGWLAEEYNINFSVEDVSASIDFSGLVVTLNHLQLPDSKGLPFTLKVDYLFLHLNFWDSVFSQRLNFNRISLKGADLTLKKQNAKKKTKMSPSLSALRSLENIFLTQLKRFSVNDSRLHFEDHFGVKKTIYIDNLNWINSGEKHQGVGFAKMSNSRNDDSLRFVLNLSNKVSSNANALQGELYVAANNLNISNYLEGKVNGNAKILDARIGFQAWLKFSNSKVDRVQVRLLPSRLSWQQYDHTQSWQLKGGYLQLTNSKKGWRFDSYGIKTKQNNNKYSTLRFSGVGDDDNLALRFSGVTLSKILPFYFLSRSVSTEQASMLRNIALDASVDMLTLQKKPLQNRQFSLQLSAFKTKAKGTIPGITNARIALSGDLNKGVLSIKLTPQKVYFDGLFSRPMPIKLGEINIHWQRMPTGLKLFSKKSILNTVDIKSESEFSLFIPNQEAHNQQIFLSLYSYVSLNDTSKAQYYYPIKAMGEGVFKYLAPTLKKGHVTGAKILWYGALSDYPYKKKEGIFQAWVPVRDAQYDFYRKWPGLHNLDLDLLFENETLTMQAKQASLGELSLKKLTGRVDSLSPKGTLTIWAEIRDDAKKVQNYLNISPLKSSVGKALDIINVQKEISGKLKITVPFNTENRQTKTEGVVQLKNNDITLKLGANISIPLHNVNGEFRFINAQLVAENISASLYNEKLNIDFSTQQSATHYAVKATLDGRWQLDALSKKIPWLSALKVKGNFEWQGDVDFSYAYNAGYQYQINLNSEVQGVYILLPAPYHKNALQSWPSTLTLSGDQKTANVVFNVKNKLAFFGGLNYADGTPKITYLQLNLGEDNMPLLEKNRQAIHVQFDELNATPWLHYWRKLKEENPQFFVKNNDVSFFNIRKISAEIKRFSFLEQPLFSLKIDANKKMQEQQSIWSAKIFSDNLQGKVEYRDGSPIRIKADIDKLNLQLLDLSEFKSTPSSKNLILDYPEIFVECRECRYKQMDLSPLSIHIYPSEKLLYINKINVGEGQELTKITGFWDQHLTVLSIKSTANRGHNLVKRLGFSSPIVAHDAFLEGYFNWVGAPWQFNLDSLNGKFSADLNDGSITQVSDKGARLLSILSLDGIRRSLNMEFGDVFAKGFSFDDLTLTAKITKGIIKTDDFNLNGSAGKLSGGGFIDLPNMDINYHLSYSPAITSSLPLLTAFAINPLTGAAVLLLTKILEPVVDAIVRIDFVVKGALNNPEVRIVTRQEGLVELQNSDALEAINQRQVNDKQK